MLLLQDLSYAFPGREPLFTGLRLALAPAEHIALIGNNGVGKSTLLRIMAGELAPTAGQLARNAVPYHVPQSIVAPPGRTIADALGISAPLNALQRILAGTMAEADLHTLNDDWSLEDRCRSVLAEWDLGGKDLHTPLRHLSGGERTRVVLAGIRLHGPELLLLDEPTNHLDRSGRERLHALVQDFPGSLVVVSHDRTLLDLLDTMVELGPNGLTRYGGNYSFYHDQRSAGLEALQADVDHAAKALRKARKVERDSMERQQRLDARGKRKQEKSGLPTIAMNTLRNQAEKSTARTKGVHADKVADLRSALHDRLAELPDTTQLKLAFGTSALHSGKLLVEARGLNLLVNGTPLWPQDLDITIASGERIALHGANGSGKTSLLRMILGQRIPDTGTLHRATTRTLYLDQHQSLLDDAVTIYEQAQHFNTRKLPEHEVRTRLDRSGFPQASWDKPTSGLSGGERTRLLLCCLTTSAEQPDLLVLDEPTNNLDIASMEILTAAVQAYQGSLLVVSHDAVFLEALGVEREVVLG